MGPTWVLLAPYGPHVGPMNLAMRALCHVPIGIWWHWSLSTLVQVIACCHYLNQCFSSVKFYDILMRVISCKYFLSYYSIKLVSILYFWITFPRANELMKDDVYKKVSTPGVNTMAVDHLCHLHYHLWILVHNLQWFIFLQNEELYHFKTLHLS